jgi:hypothetical protein
MKKKLTICLTHMSKLLLAIAICYFAFNLSSCTKKFYYTYVGGHYVDSNWVDWNVSMQNGISGQGSGEEAALESMINAYVSAYNVAHSTTYRPEFFPSYCPCDSTLFNFKVTLYLGSGQSSGTPPPPPPPPGGSGGLVDVLSQNHSFEVDSPRNDYKHDTTPVVLPTRVIDTSKTLAIMDTGLDPAYFKPGITISNLIWAAPPGITSTTMRNFTPGHLGMPDFFDDNDDKHGTAVAALALDAILQKDALHIPRLMILKVLDKNKVGSSFSVSCAMSYAIQNRASIINASLGYYSFGGQIDSVLRKYILRAANATPTPILFVAAAGNAHVFHFPSQFCNVPGINHLDSPSLLFFPACFSNSISNVISVTTVTNDLTSSCHYQNYSKDFVTIGVRNEGGCCVFPVPFLRAGYEGSSFATPIVSGSLMGCLLQPGSTAPSVNCLNQISQTTSSLQTITKDGRFLGFKTSFR